MTSLAELAPEFAHTIVEAVRREYPNVPRHVMTGPDDTATPRQLHPAFYGCFDWHSAVEMHWALVVLLPDLAEPVRARAERVLDEHLTEENLAVEAAYLRDHAGFERPYGWGWALALADAADGTRWAAPLASLAAVATEGFAGWLPRSQRQMLPRLRPKSGLVGAPLMGVTFGLGWTPCLGPTLATVQTLAFTEASAGRGATLAAVYAAGLGLPFIAVGLGMRRALTATQWARGHTVGIKRAGAVMLITTGLLLATGVWDHLMRGLQSTISGYTTVL